MAKTDATTLELIKEVAKRKKEIESTDKASYTTNCSFSYNGGAPVNLRVITDIGELIHMSAFLLEREKSYKEAATLLGVTEPPPMSWNGVPTKDWQDDFKTRINKVLVTTKKKKLELLEERLNKIISPELRAELELEAIKADLG